MNETNEKENKIDESAQQSAETIEELINRKVEELLQKKFVKVINLSKEEVLRDWKEQEQILKRTQKIPEKINEQSINIISEYLANEYLKTETAKKYKKYLDKNLETLQLASQRRLENSMDRYLIPGLGIMRQQKIGIYSTPNVGKTFLSLEMAYKMAIGGWLFNTPEYAVPRPFKTLYVDNENYDTLIDRLDRMIMYNRDLANQNMRFIRNGNVLKEDGTIEELPVNRFGKIDEKTDSLADAIIAISRATDFIPDVIFIDPLADVMWGDENKTQDMENFKKDIDRLVKELGATVIINHHSRKDNSGDLYGLRGSTVLPGALDMAIELRAKEQKDDEEEDNEKEEFEPPLDTEEKEDGNKTRESIFSFNMTKNRTGAKLRSFYLGIYDTPLEELSFKPPVDNAEIEKGLLVAKIYKNKEQGKPPTAITLHMAEMIALMYKKGLDPVTISNEDYQEKIYSSFKKVESYRKYMEAVDNAHLQLNTLINKFIKSKKETTSIDNDKPINPFI